MRFSRINTLNLFYLLTRLGLESPGNHLMGKE